MRKYHLFPIIENEPEIPLTCEPVPLHEVFQIIKLRMELLEAQGYWWGSNCQEISIESVGFAIRPADTHTNDQVPV